MTGSRSTEPFLIADSGIASAFLAGRKTQVRVGASSALSACVAGDHIRVRESCLAARHEAGRDIVTTPGKAEFAIFRDGWRQYRDGSGTPGRPPGDGDYIWVAAGHMPRWAPRIRLVVEAVHRERLQQITRADIRAEGARPMLGALLWRWPPPIPGRHLTARRAFAGYWNVNHPTPGDRWEDDPIVIVLDVRVEPRPARDRSTDQ